MSNKHDANVRKSTLVNFQIGLVASLLFTYVMFEVYTQVPIVNVEEPKEEWVQDVVWSDNFTVEKKVEKKLAIKSTPKKPQDLTDPEIVEDDTALKDLENEFKADPPEDNTGDYKPEDIDNLPDEVEPVHFPFNKVEFVPIFPGCEDLSSNKEKAQCFSDKIRRLVSRKFNTDLGADLGLSGLQRIYVQFDVYKDGTIQNVRARAPHPKLEKEAVRIVKNFPKMTPGSQRGKSVTVKYSLPIAFKIAN